MNHRTQTLVERAAIFAAECHQGQIRKYTGDPYIRHPRSVVALVQSVPHTEAMLCAAWLHDVVEDTGATIEDLRQIFGEEVASLVVMLTDVSTLNDGNRATRKAIDRAHLANASPAAQTVKLADLIDNAESIACHDPKFAAVYFREKTALLEVLTGGDARLWQRAQDIIAAFYERRIP